jgi:hypothetical protein
LTTDKDDICISTRVWKFSIYHQSDFIGSGDIAESAGFAKRVICSRYKIRQESYLRNLIEIKNEFNPLEKPEGGPGVLVMDFGRGSRRSPARGSGGTVWVFRNADLIQFRIMHMLQWLSFAR